MLGQEVMTSYIRSCSSADFAIYRIWARFVTFWSVLLYCRQHNWCLWISRSHIQLPRIKVTQGHACHGPFPWLTSTVIILTLQLSWASGSLFRAKLSNLKSALTIYHWLYMTRYVSRSSKVIRGHMRSLTSDVLEWPNFPTYLTYLTC